MCGQTLWHDFFRRIPSSRTVDAELKQVRTDMLIVYGAYHFRPKRIAFRNDYCLTCGEACRSVQIRTFDVGHIFWIPVLPVGFWKRWVCTACGHQPHVSPKTRRFFKWAGLFVLLFLSVMSWVEPVERNFAAFTWICRIGASLGAAFL